ncbi:MAG: pyridoxamine kinase [Solobacterium sp.]|nr:pyridoxamine kinase [Solobacterium sp.]MBR3342764.1 pyridoxamine kinase [Solobacterium sp.]
MKKVVTMQDISCVGKCSITAAFPVISAMGVETALIPTAVLSTHTMFQGFTFCDLTKEIRPIMDHWEKEQFRFDGIYTGYLGSFEQLDIASELFERFGKDGFILVDPAMADNGKLYYGFDQKFADQMAKLCGKADYICPNLTEASFMLRKEYCGDNYDEAYVREELKELCALGAKTAILTGISLEKGKTGAYAYDSVNDEYHTFFTDEQPEHFHGTGDLWAGTLCGALTIGKSLDDAMKIACLFVAESIRLTLAEKDHNTYGVNFEQAIPYLIKLLNE